MRPAVYGWILAALLVVSQTAQAGFVAPAYAGQPHSTTSIWNYNGDWTAGNSASHLTSFTSVGGMYPLSTETPGCGGMPCLNGDNQFPAGDNLTFYIPDFVDPLPLKKIRVQFQFVRVIPPNPNFPDPFVHDVQGFDPLGFVPGLLQASSYVTETVMKDGVFYTYGLFDFTLTPNPDYERLTISGVLGSELKRVRIDTISTVPEPATLLLLVISVIGMTIARGRSAAA